MKREWIKVGTRVRRTEMGEGVIVGRQSDNGWIAVFCDDGLLRCGPEDRLILTPSDPNDGRRLGDFRYDLHSYVTKDMGHAL